MNIIEVKNLKKYFGKIKAVDDISFSVKKGEIFGFLGPNGAGKTTTIRLFLDFIRPTSGQAFIKGLDCQKDSVEIKKYVGYLSGEIRLYDKWSGKEHIEFIENTRGKSKIKKELIRKLDFNPKMRAKYLSSGNKQKLGLILALMHQPEVLILDEPTLGLDPLLQNTIYEILEDFRKQGTTVFMSSHNLPEVERVCDRAGIIKEGKIVGIETIEQLGEKRLRRIEVQFKDKYKKSDFKFNGVENIEEIADGLILTVRGDIDPVVKKLAKYKLHDLEISHATLEDVFLEFYQH
ncbi:MAG: ATP-binding cassette domain-containing protein [Candidatus Aenigmarchaeota archaeon]|nr:ATP-binding cassette domain-containing protein [Candidatus Aenigmarchaeota archaeon]